MNFYKISIQEFKWKNSICKLMRTWENNIQMYLKRINWIKLAPDGDQQQALVKTAINLGFRKS